MKITRLVLKKFSPFIVPDIDVLDYNIDKDMQIILGTNGCGKSKLFQQLSPMPPDNNLFEANGLKEIHITHQDKKYILKSVFDSKAKSKHSFVCLSDGIELNEGGTVTIQKELVNDLFGYDDKMHAILTGKLKFTEMSSAQRKDFLFRVSGMDFDYALKLFDLVKSKHRDLVGACKHVSSRVADLKAKVSSEDNQKGLELRLENVMSDIDKLKSFLSSVERDIEQSSVSEDPAQRLALLDKESKFARDLFDKTFNIDSYAAVPTLDSLSHEEGMLHAKIGNLENDLSEVSKKAMELTSVSSKLEVLEDEEKEGNVTERIASLESTLEELTAAIVPIANFDNIDEHSLTKMFNELLSLADAHSLPLHKIEREEAIHIKGRYNNLTAKLNETVMDNRRLSDKLNGLIESSCVTVKCVKCDHVNTLDPEATADNINNLKNSVRENLAIIDNLEKEKLSMEEGDYGRVLDAEKAFIEVNRCINGYGGSLLSAVSTLLKSHGMSMALSYVFNTQYFNSTLNNLLSMIKMKKEKEKLSAKYELLKDYLNFKDMGIEKSVALLEERHTQIEDRLFSLREEVNKVTSLKDSISKLIDANDKASSLIDELSLNAANNIYRELRDDVKQRLKLLSDESLRISAALYQAKHSINLLEDTRSEFDKLDVKKTDMKTLLDALSPTTGIIGDNLRQLLESFTRDVNNRIASIWSYDMELLPYSNENKLDFKIPFTVINKTIGDVNEGSQGQKDIINFAIMLCVMDYMNLQDYPTFMDEIGSTFDTAHSAELINFTNSLVTEGKVSQLFMISHHVSHYGGHLNADVVVLAEGNLLLPETYNENVKIS